LYFKMLLGLLIIYAVAGAGTAQRTATAGCLSWCRHTHSPEEFFCCRADPKTLYHYGQCPQRFSVDIMTPRCRGDHHCQPHERCCFSPVFRQHACVAALSNRFQPRKPELSLRFGGGWLSGSSNNYDSLGFKNTYRSGDQGWGHMGKIEPM
ncbi:WAP-type 'four-disulfide core' domain, partial [Trinorchestia longiramus]